MQKNNMEAKQGVIKMDDFLVGSVLTVEEVAGILKISRTKAYEYVNSGAFPVIKIGRSIRIPSDPFFMWLNSPSIERSCGRITYPEPNFYSNEEAICRNKR